MALATTCPQCKTSFKVVPDQLKLRRGLVRCGVCQHVFSGIDYLRYVDDAARAAQRVARERAAQGTPPTGEPPAGLARPGAAPIAPPPAGPLPRVVASAPTGSAAVGDGGGLVTSTGGTSGAFGRNTTPGGFAAPTAPPAATPPLSPTAAPVPTASPSSMAAASPMAAPSPTVTSMPPAAASLPMPATGQAPFASPTSFAPAAPLASPGQPPAAPAAERPAAAPFPGPDTAAAAPTAAAEPAVTRFPLPPGIDPWAAAAHEAHERSLRDTPPIDAAGTAPSNVAPFVPTPTTAPSDEPASAFAPPREAQDGRAPASSAPSPVFPEPTPPRDARPALPAPAGAARPPAPDLDDLLARPTRAWPSATEGPQTIIPADEDLKTAFFLPDTAIGPATRMQAGPPTVPAEPDPITLLRPEGRGVQDDGAPFDAPASDPAPLAPPVAAPLPAWSPREAESAIDYFSGRGARSRGLGLALSPAAWVAATVLSLLLGLQAVVGWRDGLAARVPFLAPVLGALLSPFGAQPVPPREIDSLTIEGFELQAAAGAPDVLQLSAVLRNRSGHVVGYPAMELTLTDSAGAMLVRKVIPAEAYLPDAPVRDAGLAGGTERPLKLALEHGGLQPTGYTVALFYP